MQRQTSESLHDLSRQNYHENARRLATTTHYRQDHDSEGALTRHSFPYPAPSFQGHPETDFMAAQQHAFPFNPTDNGYPFHRQVGMAHIPPYLSMPSSVSSQTGPLSFGSTPSITGARRSIQVLDDATACRTLDSFTYFTSTLDIPAEITGPPQSVYEVTRGRLNPLPTTPHQHPPPAPPMVINSHIPQALQVLPIEQVLPKVSALTGPSNTRRDEASAMRPSSYNRRGRRAERTSPVLRKESRRQRSSGIRGIPSMSFTHNGDEGIRLDVALRRETRGLSDPQNQDFFDGFGEKMSLKIYLGNDLYFTKQRRCRHRQGKKFVYYTRERIAHEVAEFMRDFIEAVPNFQTYPSFEGWPIGAGIENFKLLELRKISHASVQPIFEYTSSVSV
ncbi:hypothetical protein NM688_g1638 [Phlebia brevispora]|uniref:Uncharacterized protein n=1 Tax=Phlebia brevispora TaxID=194682 RepID=A0ACC1TAM7_9APHY|nr:hypothetical protein NM688_g1638 [Phlebia brevispora]